MESEQTGESESRGTGEKLVSQPGNSFVVVFTLLPCIYTKYKPYFAFKIIIYYL